MRDLPEIAGAMERPAGCKVKVSEHDDGVMIAIPARGASPVMWITTIAFLVVLSGWIITGLTFFFTGNAVLILALIANHGIPSGLRRSLLWVSPLWLLMLALGCTGFLWILRTNLARESLVFGPTSIRHVRVFGPMRSDREFPKETVRSFILKTDPHGFNHGTLTLVCQGDEIEVGEFLTDTDREWICSVGNTILRRPSL